MNLTTSLATVSQWWFVSGRSDGGLCRTGTSASPVQELDGQIAVRPLNALRGLALATRPAFGSDVLGAYTHWALLRYLGAFAGTGSHLVLSPAGEGVAGNQRRVMSEDLGVALGLEVASTWIRADAPIGSPLWVADFDSLRHRYPTAGLARAGPRPDYVLMAGDPREPRDVRMGLLECKGTRTPQHVARQLLTGITQITPMVEATGLPGLVVSSLFTDARVEYCALAVNPRRTAMNHELGRAVLLTAAAGLAEYCGMNESERQASRRQARLGAADDDAVIGVTNVLSLPGGAAEVLFGADRRVYAVLGDQNVDELVTAQLEVSGNSVVRNAREGWSYGPDGSVLVVNPIAT